MLSNVLTADSYQFPSQLNTGFSGIRALNSFFHQFSGVSNRDIFLDFSETEFFDANLSSLLLAIIFKLGNENGLRFHVDGNKIKEDLQVLIRNGLIKVDQEIYDDRKSTVTCRYFTEAQTDEFKQYVEVDLFEHRAFQGAPRALMQKVVYDLLEIFNNYIQHSKSIYPFFVCGQYFPKKKTLVFTMADLGVGFLPAIKQFTQQRVTSASDAISWAVAGNSSKTNQQEMPAGLGLVGIRDYCLETSGYLQIATGDAYWETSHKNGRQYIGMNFTVPIAGTVISIHFAC